MLNKAEKTELLRVKKNFCNYLQLATERTGKEFRLKFREDCIVLYIGQTLAELAICGNPFDSKYSKLTDYTKPFNDLHNFVSGYLVAQYI